MFCSTDPFFNLNFGCIILLFKGERFFIYLFCSQGLLLNFLYIYIQTKKKMFENASVITLTLKTDEHERKKKYVYKKITTWQKVKENWEKKNTSEKQDMIETPSS